MQKSKPEAEKVDDSRGPESSNWGEKKGGGGGGGGNPDADDAFSLGLKRKGP